MSNYIKKYNTGNIMVDLPHDSYIHELPLLSFSDFRNSVNISLVYNHKLKLDSNNMFNIANGYKLNIQKRIVMDDNNNPIKFIDANGKQIILVKNYNSLNESSPFNGVYTFDDESKRILRSTSTGYEIEHEDLSKEEYNLTGYIKKIKDKYGDTYLSYNYNSNNNLSSVTYNGKTVYFGYFLNQLNYIEYGNTETTLEYSANKITVYHYSGVTYESTLTGNNYKIEAKANEGTTEISYSKTCEYDENKMIMKSKIGTDIIDNIEYLFPNLITGNYSSFRQVEIKNKKGVTQRIQFENNKPMCSYDANMTSIIDLSDKYCRNVNIYKIMNEDIDNKFNGTLSYRDGNFMTKDINNPTFYEADITGNVNKKGKYIVTGWLKSTSYNSNNTIFISDVTDQTGINFYVSTPELNKWYFFAYQFEINVNTVKVYCPFAGVELGDLRLTYYSYESLNDTTNSSSIYSQDILINKSNSGLLPFKDAEFYYATESGYSGCIKMTLSDVLRYYNRKIKYGLVNELYYNDGKNVITDLLRVNVKPKELNTYYNINDFHIGYRSYKNGNEFKTKLEIDVLLNEPFKINSYKNSSEYSEQLLNEDFDVVQSTEDNITTNFTRDKGLITRETIEGLSNISYTYNTNTLVVKDEANNNYLYDGVTYYADSTWGTIYKTEYSDGLVLEDIMDDDKTTLIKKRFLKGSNVIENNFGYSKSQLSFLNSNALNYNFTYSKDKLSNVKKNGSDIVEQVHTDVSKTIYFPNIDNFVYYDQLVYDQYYRLTDITNKIKYYYSNEGLIEKIDDNILDLTHYYSYNNKGMLDGVAVISSNDTTDIKSSEGFIYDKENRLTSKEYAYDFSINNIVKDEIEYVKAVEDPYIDERVSNSKYYIAGTKIVTSSSEYDAYKRLKEKSYEFNEGTSVKTYEKIYNYDNNRINQERTNLSNITSNVIQYTYDNFDRISNIQNVNKLSSYQYDDFGRLIRENNEALDKTIVYEYNDIGNITSRKIYDYTIATTPTTLLSTIPYEYDTTQKDRLISYNNTTIPYNVLGCPTELKDYSLTWSKGNLIRLNKGTLQTGTESYTYTYNAYGQRVSKVYNKMAGPSGIIQIQPEEVVNRSTQFNYDNSGRLINEIITNTCYNGDTFSEKLEYIYDVNTIIGMKYTKGSNTNTYYFERNILGDVLGIYDLNGNLKVKYLYDAYGNCTVSSETTDQQLAKVNPIRYRGYYYDVETGWFWLSSRYYSPELCRFISPDDIEYLDPESVNGLNLYCYCLNNPIMYVDPSGHMPEWLETTLKIVGGVTIIAGCIVGSIFTCGTLSVILAGAAVGAIAGGVSAGISTAVSGGSIHDFGSAFLMSTITGAASGAVCASPLGMWAQAGINAVISSLTYVGTQLMNEDNITLGGLVSSSIFGFATGAIGGNGWMQNSGVKAFIESGAKGFIKNIVSNVGISSLVRIGAPAVGLGGISSGLYGKYVSNKYNPNGNFWGW